MKKSLLQSKHKGLWWLTWRLKLQVSFECSLITKKFHKVHKSQVHKLRSKIAQSQIFATNQQESLNNLWNKHAHNSSLPSHLQMKHYIVWWSWIANGQQRIWSTKLKLQSSLLLNPSKTPNESQTRTEKRSTIEGSIATLFAYKLQWNFETQVGEEGGL